MGYTTYSFYTDTYFGDSVEESSFDKWNSKASSKLDYLTNGKIDSDIITTYPNEIKMATCALIDCLYGIDEAQNNATNPSGGNIKSMSSGGQSVTFGENDTIYTKAMGDVKATDSLCLDVIREHLYATDLLYEGV